MQRRTSFCRSLIHDPPLILMDEPLGALDAMTREQLNADLERLWIRRTKTVIELPCPRTLEVCENSAIPRARRGDSRIPSSATE